MGDKAFYNDLVKKVISSKEKYYFNMTKNDAIKLMRKNIIHDESKDNALFV